jgi:hypothetical protein
LSVFQAPFEERFMPTMRSFSRRRGWAFLLVLACAATGCSSSSTNAKLTGKVFIGTEPLDGGRLIFIPVNEADGGGGNGSVDEDGKYSATITKPGKMKVYVSLPTQAKVPAGVKYGPPKDTVVPEGLTSSLPPPRKSKVVVPVKYTAAKTTDYIVEIEPGTHELNIEFKK